MNTLTHTHTHIYKYILFIVDIIHVESSIISVSNIENTMTLGCNEWRIVRFTAIQTKISESHRMWMNIHVSASVLVQNSYKMYLFKYTYFLFVICTYFS